METAYYGVYSEQDNRTYIIFSGYSANMKFIKALQEKGEKVHLLNSIQARSLNLRMLKTHFEFTGDVLGIKPKPVATEEKAEEAKPKKEKKEKKAKETEPLEFETELEN